MILVLDTHAEEVFVGLWDEDSAGWIHTENFVGGRQLNSLILTKFSSIKLADLVGIIVAAGPGSFTGLRIGISVANTLAYALNIPIVAPSETESAKELLQKGLNMLKSAGLQFNSAVVPSYGAEPHITKSKK
jgi:tRNA threonylcarbamoyl adenosine modification protein YeaZ